MDNNNENFNESIEDILSDFKDKKERKEHAPIEPLEPPKKRENLIDFAKNDEDDAQAEKTQKRKKAPKPEKTPEELEKLKAQRAEKRSNQKQKAKKALQKVKKAVFNKKVLITLAAIIAVVGIVFGVQYAVKAAKGAYLKPYESKYPDAHFEIGMQKKYCDMIGENPDTVGYIEIPELDLKSPVSSQNDKDISAQGCTDGAEQFNYVVYLNDKSLEKFYSSANAYNNAGGYITYSDLFEDYSFKVVGAFYTNMNAEDDNGYIFPYNVTEKMTVKSASEFASRLENRFIYNTGINVTRQDTLLTISCPTDYKKDFRFVVVGVLRDDTNIKSTATEKSSIRYPQIIFDEMKTDNPYKFASKWYPEIIITDKEGNETTIQKTIDDYKMN